MINLETVEKFILRAIIVIVSLFILSGAVFVAAQLSVPRLVVLNGIKIKVDLADTPEKQTRGLSGQPALADDEGLLFVYDGYYLPKFWMKDMLFPIDIIWLKDGMVAGWEDSAPVPADGEILPTYQPPIFINEVLEVRAGFVRDHGIKIGDHADKLF